MRKLEPSVNFIKVQSNSTIYGQFIIQENLRYIDLDNLNKYSVKDLISIYGMIGGKPKKQDYINAILKSDKLIAKIKSDNRQIKLDQLGF